MRMYIHLPVYSALIISQVWFAAGESANAWLWAALAIGGLIYGEWKIAKMNARRKGV